MQETELKFQVPPAAREAVARAVGTAAATRTRLQAVYFDTAGRDLAGAGIALRLRREGRHWVQTLKAGDAHAMQRLEHNVTLPARPAGGVALDLRRHAGHPAGQALFALLDALPPAGEPSMPDAAAAGPEPWPARRARLHERYRTDITRVHREQRLTGGRVELAYDSGRILAGDAVLPVCELEIELVAGPPSLVIEAARRWVARHGLWLDVRTKAERGDRLAQGLAQVPAVRAGDSPLGGDHDGPGALRAALRSALAQVLPNAAEIAGGHGHDEHLHQLRVGLRRLRSLWRLLDGLAPSPAEGVEAGLRMLFQDLGATRDRDALAAALGPALEAAGAPWFALPASIVGIGDTDPPTRLRGRAANGLWLELLAATLPPAERRPLADAGPDRPEADPEPGADRGDVAILGAAALRRRLARRLKRWHTAVAIEPKAFLALDDEARHSLRKRVKRLRYAAEFVAPLFPPKRVARYLARLRRLQAELGHFNDLCVADPAYREAAVVEPRAWFVVGWIAARREQVLQAAAVELRRVGKAQAFWRSRR